jgi:ketosteroid isomerase-like protein
MEHPNAIAVRKMGDALEKGDFQALDDAFTDDVVWHEIGGVTKRGKAALREEDATADDDITFKLHDVVANDDHTIALGEATATRGDKSLTYRTAEIYHVKDGKIAEHWAFSDDTKAITDFFGS